MKKFEGLLDKYTAAVTVLNPQIYEFFNDPQKAFKVEENKAVLENFKADSLKDFKIIEELGRGSYGVVYKVACLHNNQEYVMKKINLKHLKKKDQDSAIKECQILRKTNHRNIIKYYASFFEKECIFIIMEYAQGGDLQTVIILFFTYKLIKNQKKNGKFFSENEIWNFALELCSSVCHLHTNHILHRDIKALNIFLTKERSLKLGDLGVSKISQPGEMEATRVGTPLYLAPELVKQQKYDYRVDVWAIGCVLYHCATLEPPFTGNNLISLGFNIVHRNPKSLPAFYSNNLNKFIFTLLEKNPTKRISAIEIMEKFFTKNSTNDVLIPNENKLKRKLIIENSQKNENQTILDKNNDIHEEKKTNEIDLNKKENRIVLEENKLKSNELKTKNFKEKNNFTDIKDDRLEIINLKTQESKQPAKVYKNNFLDENVEKSKFDEEIEIDSTEKASQNNLNIKEDNCLSDSQEENLIKNLPNLKKENIDKQINYFQQKEEFDLKTKTTYKIRPYSAQVLKKPINNLNVTNEKEVENEKNKKVNNSKEVSKKKIDNKLNNQRPRTALENKNQPNFNQKSSINFKFQAKNPFYSSNFNSNNYQSQFINRKFKLNQHFSPLKNKKTEENENGSVSIVELLNKHFPTKENSKEIKNEIKLEEIEENLEEKKKKKIASNIYKKEEYPPNVLNFLNIKIRPTTAKTSILNAFSGSKAVLRPSSSETQRKKVTLKDLRELN